MDLLIIKHLYDIYGLVKQILSRASAVPIMVSAFFLFPLAAPGYSKNTWFCWVSTTAVMSTGLEKQLGEERV